MKPDIIRSIDGDEVERLVAWAAAEGWNPGLNDASVFRSADPEGFIGGFVGGEMVAGISAVAYGAAYGFVGLYITRPDMRGKGLGKAIWQAGMARLAGRVVGLDGVDEQFENYRSKGFEPAYRTIRYGGRFRAPPSSIPVAPTQAVDGRLAAEIAAFDRRSFPEPRDGFLERWLAPPHIARASISRDGSVSGYGVMRQCRQGWKIGGLTAVDDDKAAALVGALARGAADDIYIDVPAERSSFIDLLTQSGLSPGFETTRMYAGGVIPLSPLLFGVTSLELG